MLEFSIFCYEKQNKFLKKQHTLLINQATFISELYDIYKDNKSRNTNSINTLYKKRSQVFKNLMADGGTAPPTQNLHAFCSISK